MKEIAKEGAQGMVLEEVLSKALRSNPQKDVQ